MSQLNSMKMSNSDPTHHKINQEHLWRNDITGLRAFVFIFIGLLIVLVYSRLFGMGELWHTIMADHFNRTVKNVVEEGSELWGYALVFWGTVNYWRASTRA